MTRDNDNAYVDLDERSDMANAWGADFFYSIHSDAGSPSKNSTVFLFGGWKSNGNYVEKTPNGGKRMGDIMCPNLTGVMYNTETRGNYYDRVFYNGDVDTHENQYPYLSVNRRTNMASILSEGGYHTLPMQQALNINESYKRLEGFATARSIMEFRGLARPEKIMLAGVVTNSENGQPINNVSVTVNGKTIVTDSYESIFHKYVKNPNLVHNGFFLFEDDLVPGQEVEVEEEVVLTVGVGRVCLTTHRQIGFVEPGKLVPNRRPPRPSPPKPNSTLCGWCKWNDNGIDGASQPNPRAFADVVESEIVCDGVSGSVCNGVNGSDCVGVNGSVCEGGKMSVCDEEYWRNLIHATIY